MTRSDLEAFIWRRWPTRGTLASRQVDAILAAADAYATSKAPQLAYRRCIRCWGLEPPPVRHHHTSSTDLHELIGVLAGALLSNETERAA